MCPKGAMHLAGCGIGLRAPHVTEVLERRPAVAWREVHAENYSVGGPARRALERLRGDYPVSGRGVGLSIDIADRRHAQLERRARLVERSELALYAAQPL